VITFYQFVEVYFICFSEVQASKFIKEPVNLNGLFGLFLSEAFVSFGN
jgi:hypothetical protein